MDSNTEDYRIVGGVCRQVYSKAVSYSASLTVSDSTGRELLHMLFGHFASLSEAHQFYEQYLKPALLEAIEDGSKIESSVHGL